MAVRWVGLAGVIVGPLLALAAAAGVEAATVVGLGLVAGGICGALVAPAEAVDRRARLAPIYPGAGLAALGLAGLALVAGDWLVLRAAGPAVAVGAGRWGGGDRLHRGQSAWRVARHGSAAGTPAQHREADLIG